ncbi:MAG: DNA-3-methyladenine glycosylase I [Desulfobacteraceae bacterium]|nr:MAG: DNA-3-methyladenine glycosylase I [Desulfobacteraceae bacterium]
MNRKSRCGWTGNDELMIRYHDLEWGVPVHDDRKWFQYIVLDAFQAGLSWRSVLHKREGFIKVFSDFDPEKVARMSRKRIDKACENPAIIRNRMKIEATVRNAKAFLRLQETHGSFDEFIWAFTDGKVIRNRWKSIEEIPPFTPLSDRVSAALKKEDFSFVGTTICYAILQSGGIVNDHIVGCFRYDELNRKRERDTNSS